VIPNLFPTLCVAILRSSFVEPSEQVRGTMWRPLLKFLKGMSYPEFCHYRSAHTLQISLAPGRSMLRLNSIKQTKASQTRKRTPLAQKTGQKDNPLPPLLLDHHVSQSFYSF
jgi:hypothetical protein